jgi:rRNA maturation endonuclease Nob1
MKFSDVMIYYDYNLTNIARALGITKQYVAIWKKKDEIPWNFQCQLEVITKGKLKAGKQPKKTKDK